MDHAAVVSGLMPGGSRLLVDDDHAALGIATQELARGREAEYPRADDRDVVSRFGQMRSRTTTGMMRLVFFGYSLNPANVSPCAA